MWKLLFFFFFFYFFALKRYLNVNFDDTVEGKTKTGPSSIQWKGNPGSNGPNIKKVKNIASRHHVTTSTMGCLLLFKTLRGVQKNVVYFMQSLTSHPTSVYLSKGFLKSFLAHSIECFQWCWMLLWGRGAIWDNNMHKEQCIGPGHWASPWWFPVCFNGSVSQQIHYCKQLAMSKVNVTLGERGPSLKERRHLVDKQSSSLSRLAMLWRACWLQGIHPISVFEFWERETDQAWTGGLRKWCKVCIDTRCGDRSVAFFNVFFKKSGLLCAVSISLCFTAEPFPTHNRPEKWPL